MEANAVRILIVRVVYAIPRISSLVHTHALERRDSMRTETYAKWTQTVCLEIAGFIVGGVPACAGLLILASTDSAASGTMGQSVAEKKCGDVCKANHGDR
jgi:hypothetical protein